MLPQFQSVHFIGVCGTAMASVAAALKERGVRVTGSDHNVYPPMSTFLESRGIKVREGIVRKISLIAGPRGDRQRHQSRKSRGGGCVGAQAPVLCLAGVVERGVYSG